MAVAPFASRRLEPAEKRAPPMTRAAERDHHDLERPVGRAAQLTQPASAQQAPRSEVQCEEEPECLDRQAKQIDFGQHPADSRDVPEGTLGPARVRLPE